MKDTYATRAGEVIYRGTVCKTFDAFRAAKEAERSKGIYKRSAGLSNNYFYGIAAKHSEPVFMDYCEYLSLGGKEIPEERMMIFRSIETR